jgi:hypothetical protein
MNNNNKSNKKSFLKKIWDNDFVIILTGRQFKKSWVFTLIMWLIILVGIIGLATSCSKQPPLLSKARFSGSVIDRGLKEWYTIDHAKAIVDQDTFNLSVYYDDGVPFTESFEIGEGQHTVTHFIVYDDQNNEIGASPIAGSTYDYLVGYDTLPKQFNVQYAVVTEVPVKVLYMTAEDYDLTNFGYAYFAIDPAYIHYASFFGLKGTPDSLLYHYNASNSDYKYVYQPAQEVMHAIYWIFYLHKRGNGPWTSVMWYQSSFINNGYIYDIPFIDYENSVDSSEFRIELHAWYPAANSMSFFTTGTQDYSMSIVAVDDSIISGPNGLTTFGFAPDSSWFPSVNYFFQYDY